MPAASRAAGRAGAEPCCSLWRDVELTVTFYHGEGESTMTNEELVALIQGGERDRLPELWAQVERFVAVQAHKRMVLGNGFGGVQHEDLYNAGYIALVKAADTFDPEAGGKFIGWLALALKTAFAEAGGYRSRKQAQDPLHRAGSTDAPALDDEDSATLGELQEDPRAVQAFEDAESRIYCWELHNALEELLAQLPPEWSDALRRRYYQGQNLAEIAAAMGVESSTVQQWQSKGLRELRRNWRRLERFVEGRTS